MMDYYKLENKQPVPCSMHEWGTWFEYNKGLGRIVAQEKVDNTDILVSTVFLGFDHGNDRNNPVLFETMIFGGALSEFQNRYCTYEEAEAGHKEAVENVRAKLKAVGKIELAKIWADAKKKYNKTIKKLSL